MSRAITDRDALVSALAAEARARAAPIPAAALEPEGLLDYLEGRLSPAAEQELQRRLVASPEATARLLELAELAAVEPRAGEETAPADLATRAAWKDFSARLGAGPRARASPPRWLLGLAAALTLAALALGFRVWQLERERRAPVFHLASLELPAGLRAAAMPAKPLAPGQSLRLVVEPSERCPAYDLELGGPDGGTRRVLQGLTRDEGGTLSLLLRPRPGEYALRIWGCEPRRELEGHRFRVVAAAAP